MAIVGCRRLMAALLLVLLVALSGAQEAARPEAAVDAAEPHADPVPAQPRVEPAQPAPPSRAPRLRPRAALVAARPWSFTATASPVVLGAALAWRADDTFSPLRLGLALLTTLSVHAAGNLLNTLYDFKNGFDGTSSSDQTLVSGEMAPAQVATLVRYAYALAALAAAPLCVVSSAPPAAMLLMLAAGASSAYVYTGGPGLKYRALGDALISITFGPLLVGFSYLAQAGSLGSGALLGSLPIAAHAGAILHANNARDVDEDRANGVRTLPMALGPRGSYALYIALIALPFGASVASAWGRSALAAAPLLAAPTAAGLIRDFGAGKMARLPMRTAKFQFLFGALLVAGVLIPSPPIGVLVRRMLR